MPATQSLSKNSSMRPTDTFPEFNLVFRLSQFIHKYRINRFFEKTPFLGFRMLAIIVGIVSAIKGHEQLSKTWNFFFPKKRKLHRHWTDIFIAQKLIVYLQLVVFLIQSVGILHLDKD